MAPGCAWHEGQQRQLPAASVYSEARWLLQCTTSDTVPPSCAKLRTFLSLEGAMYADPAVSRSAMNRLTTSSATDTFLQARKQKELAKYVHADMSADNAACLRRRTGTHFLYIITAPHSR